MGLTEKLTQRSRNPEERININVVVVIVVMHLVVIVKWLNVHTCEGEVIWNVYTAHGIRANWVLIDVTAQST